MGDQISVKDSIIFNILVNTINLVYVIFILHMTACYLGPGYRVLILSNYRIVELSYCRIVVLSNYRIVELSYCRIIVLSYYRIVGGDNTIIRQTGTMAPLSHHSIDMRIW